MKTINPFIGLFLHLIKNHIHIKYSSCLVFLTFSTDISIRSMPVPPNLFGRFSVMIAYNSVMSETFVYNIFLGWWYVNIFIRFTPYYKSPTIPKSFISINLIIWVVYNYTQFIIVTLTPPQWFPSGFHVYDFPSTKISNFISLNTFLIDFICKKCLYISYLTLSFQFHSWNWNDFPIKFS